MRGKDKKAKEKGKGKGKKQQDFYKFDRTTDDVRAKLFKVSPGAENTLRMYWTKVAHMQSHSGNSYKMHKAICSALETAGVKYKVDAYGNIKATVSEGKDQGPLPAVACHIDTVHEIMPDDMYKVRIQRDVHGREIWHSPTGIGGDDKCGIALALTCLKLAKVGSLPFMHAFFFVDEEIGCLGSHETDEHWYDDVAFLVQPDRRGFEDVIDIYSGAPSVSSSFKDMTRDIFTAHRYKSTEGLWTDVFAIQDKTKKSSLNISCGYHNAHSRDEYVVFEQLVHALSLLQDLLKQTAGMAFPYEAPRKLPVTSFYRGPSHALQGDFHDEPFWHRSTGYANLSQALETQEKVNEILNTYPDWDDVPWDELEDDVWQELVQIKEEDEMIFNKALSLNREPDDIEIIDLDTVAEDGTVQGPQDFQGMYLRDREVVDSVDMPEGRNMAHGKRGSRRGKA